jgi:hypothetical protein
MIDPVTFGMVFVGTTGSAFIALSILEKRGFKINEKAVTLVLEASKTGLLLWILYKLKVFFL